jgi:hypothetical protein
MEGNPVMLINHRTQQCFWCSFYCALTLRVSAPDRWPLILMIFDLNVCLFITGISAQSVVWGLWRVLAA